MISTIRAAYPCALALAAITWLAIGCGHGSSPAVSGGNGGSGGGGGGGTTGAMLSQQARTAVLNAIAAQYASLPQTSASADAASLQSFIKTRSEFLRSGISPDNSVWATFTDGTPLVIALNDFPTASTSKAATKVTGAGSAATARGAVMPASSRGVSQLPSRSSFGVPLELPGSNTVYLINTRVPGDPAVAQVFNTLSSTYLPNNSYQPIVVQGTIENLEQIKNAGVVYNIGHAGLGYEGLSGVNNGTQVYAFGTLTARLKDANGLSSTDAAYGVEIANGEVGFLLVPTIFNSIVSGGQSRFELASGYFVTDKFILKYWTFAPNSLFMSDNCDGGSAAAQPFIQACFTTGLSTYIGWDNAVLNGEANESSLFLFDRMLGENDQSAALQPENPAQRPFDYASVLGQMATKGRYSAVTAGLTLTTSFTTDSVAYLNLGVAHLKDFENQTGSQGNFGILCPTISSASINETQKQLVLTGIFGSDPGSASHAVLVGGVDVTANTTWTQTQLTIKNLASAGAGSTGDISVSVRGHNSNTLQLTSWRGTFTAMVNPGGSESESTVYTMHLRGILNFLRSSPGGMPFVNPQGGVDSVYSDSSATWNASGSNTEGNTRETISRTGAPAIPLSNTNIIIGDTGRAGSFNLSLTFPPGSTGGSAPTMAASVYAYVNDTGGLMKTDTDLTTNQSNSFMLPYFMNFNTMPVSSMNAALDISAGKWTSTNGMQTVSWPSIPSTSGPNPTASRAAKR